MHRYLLNTVPTWACITLLCLIFSIMAYSIFMIIGRYVRPRSTEGGGSFFGAMMGATASGYAFLVGFIIVILWQMLNQAESAVRQEGQVLSQIIMESRALDDKTSEKLINLVGDYAKEVREVEWEKMRWGQQISNNSAILNKIYDTIISYVPKNETQAIFYDLKTATQLRLERLYRVDSVVPNFLKIGIFLASLALITLASMFEIKHDRIQKIVIMISAVIIAFNLSLALLLDYPFAGEVSVDNDE